MKPLLIVDGYNVIGAWREAEKKDWSIDESRDRLQRQLEDYSGASGEEIILVFDGYQSDRRVRSEEIHGNVTVVFTQRGETADSYIERYAAGLPKYRVVRVATSDGLEQSQVLSTGATRITSRELLIELRQTRENTMSAHKNVKTMQRRPISDRLPADVLAVLEKLRRYNLSERHGRALLRLPDAQSQRMALEHIHANNMNVAAAEEYIEFLLSAPPCPEKAEVRRTLVLKDVRIFLNSLKHSLELMKQGGIAAGVERQETEDSLILTISIPKNRNGQ